MYVTGETVGTRIFFGPTFAPSLNNRFRKTKEYVSNVMMIFTLLSCVCYFSIILMLLKFVVTEILEKSKFGRELKYD